MNSTGRGRGVELLRQGVDCQSGLTEANGVANRRMTVSEIKSSLATGGDHGAWGRPPGDLRPTRGRKGWRQPSFLCQCSVGGVLWVLSDLGEVANNFGVFSNAVPNRIVDVKRASANALVCARVWRRHNELVGAAAMEQASLLRHHKLLRAKIRHDVLNKRRGGRLRKPGGGLPEQHHRFR